MLDRNTTKALGRETTGYSSEEKQDVPEQRILIVDDDAESREILCENLKSCSLSVKVTEGAAAAIRALSNERFHAILCDLVMEGAGGMEVLRFVRDRNLQTPVIIITGYGDWDIARDCLSAGAFDFLTKPIDRLSLMAVVQRALLRSGLIFGEVNEAPEPQRPQQFPFLVGTSRQMQEVLRQVAKVAAADSTVCLYGESGTGKELVARAIHYSSPRSEKPLVVFDCTAIPENLMESEMFGHAKGSFTSAVADREGVFQLANGGTLFIDEIGELSLPLQAKLLRVIQTREFRKVGGKQSIKVDVRIIAATNKDLRAKVAEGTFRQDLYYRLEVIPLTLPPLRQHKDDIPPLVDHFIKRFNRSNAKQIQGVSPRMMAALLRYNWPGTVRELENCIERGAVMTDGKILDEEDVHRFLRTPESDAAALSPSEEDCGLRTLKDSRRSVERDVILRALQSVGGNRTRAAELLGVSLRTLHYKLKGLHGEDGPFVSSSRRAFEGRLAVARP